MIISCPICKYECQKYNNDYSEDFNCFLKNDHSYAVRMKENKITKLKILVKEYMMNYYLKIDYENNVTEIWSSSHTNRIKVPPFNMDFSDLKKIKQKIQTILLFI